MGAETGPPHRGAYHEAGRRSALSQADAGPRCVRSRPPPPDTGALRVTSRLPREPCFTSLCVCPPPREPREVGALSESV